VSYTVANILLLLTALEVALDSRRGHGLHTFDDNLEIFVVLVSSNKDGRRVGVV
jgi:hypothetical protein